MASNFVLLVVGIACQTASKLAPIVRENERLSEKKAKAKAENIKKIGDERVRNRANV